MHRSTTVTYTMSAASCECGCVLLNQTSGYIVGSSSTSCPSSQRVWSVGVAGGLVIQLTFIRFDAARGRGTVRVHDGRSSLSNLLLQLDASSSELPRPVTSAGNTLRVEYVLPPGEHDADDDDGGDGGFVALFRALSA